MAKNPIFIQAFFFKSKILWHVLKKILHGFYNKFVKFQRILAYISKLAKKKYFFLICEIMNLYVIYILDIK
jgi:hypothetical protein